MSIQSSAVYNYTFLFRTNCTKLCNNDCLSGGNFCEQAANFPTITLFLFPFLLRVNSSQLWNKYCSYWGNSCEQITNFLVVRWTLENNFKIFFLVLFLIVSWFMYIFHDSVVFVKNRNELKCNLTKYGHQYANCKSYDIEWKRKKLEMEVEEIKLVQMWSFKYLGVHKIENEKQN